VLHNTGLERLSVDKTLQLIEPIHKLQRKSSVINYTSMERLAMDKHCNLLGPFIINEENKVLKKWPFKMRPIS
jgi:hypothetical protein